MNLVIKNLGTVDYLSTWQAMKDFTHNRDDSTPDEIWFCQHPPVFTLGQAGKKEHILQTTDIPIINTDRGGQVTYHGPGQLMGYCLLDLPRLKLSVREYVHLLEQIIIDTLATYSIHATCKKNAPGVYVDGAKIASVGIRVRKGRTYHGFSLNINCDLSPFKLINPCGYEGQQMTSLKQLGIHKSVDEVISAISPIFQSNLDKS